MSTDVYSYTLTEKGGSKVLHLVLRDVPGPLNEWEEKPPSDILVVSSGSVTTDATGQRCFSGGSSSTLALTLFKASWSMTPDTGDAELFLYVNSSPYYTWKLTGMTTV